MHKGMLSGLWGLKWVLLCLLLIACKPNPPPPPPPSPSPEITVTGQIMLGPVLGGHSLQLVIYDPDMKELDRPKIGLDGSYGFTLKDYEGAVIAQVTSTNPQKVCLVGDYIDEATAKPKCLGNNTILSTTVLKRDDDNNKNQAKLHTTPVTTVAAISAGISIRNDGTITVAEKLEENTITQSNKTIARVLGLGDKSVAEYRPSSIITTDQKFQSCDTYCLALASVSGAEAEGQSLNDITKKISSSLNNEGKLGASIEDMMIRGIQKVAEKVQATASATSDDKTILKNLSNYQYKFKNSKLSVDLTKTLPRQPKFINDNITINREPTWKWESGGTGNKRYRYILKNYGSKDWTSTDKTFFKEETQLKPGKYTLLVQEGDLYDKDVWSKVSESNIEVVDLDKVKIGEGLIKSELKQGTPLSVDIESIKDPNGVKKDSISYQWSLDGELINHNKGEFPLNQSEVGMNVNVIVRYEDLLNNIHYIKSNISKKIKDVNDTPTGVVVLKPSYRPYLSFTANVDSISDADVIKSYSYQWKADNSDISGAVQKDFFPTDEEIGKRISVVVTVEDNLGNTFEFTSEQTSSLKAHSIPPTVTDATETFAQSQDNYFEIKEKLEIFNFVKSSKYQSTPLTFVITKLPLKGIILDGDHEITMIENGEYPEVSEGFKYKRTKAGIDSFEYKGKRDNILSLKSATIQISYRNKKPEVKNFVISAAVEKETNPIPFSKNITDDQDAIESIIITKIPNRGNLYINGKSLDTSETETIIDIDSVVTYKSQDTKDIYDSFKYKAVDTDDARSYEGNVRIEFKNDNKAPEIVKGPAQTDLMINEGGNEISFEFKITDDSSTFKAYDPLFLSTKGVASKPAWINSIDIGNQSDGNINYTIKAILNDESYANDSIRVLIPVVDKEGSKSKYAFIITPKLNLDSQNNFIKQNNTTWVDVCWQFSKTTANLDSTKISKIKQEIMNTILDSWQKNSALKFDWRQDDWNTVQAGQGKRFKWDSPSNCAENYTADYPQVKVYIKQPGENESEQAENRFTIKLNVDGDGNFVGEYPKHRIIHEFGHALGFPDENKRFDIFTGDLTKKSIESWHSWECVKSMNIQKPKVAKDNDLISSTAVTEISYKEWQQQPYDSYSIMDECIFDDPSVYVGSTQKKSQTDMLTINDIKRVQQFYGAPIKETESPHLIKDDQFFSGLFLHSNDYFYYGNGVKSSNDRFIEKRTVKMLFGDAGGIYISALTSDINEDVLFNKTYDGDGPPSFISPFPSLLLTCRQGHGDTNGFRYRFTNLCKSPDNHIADNESVYYFYDDPQSIKFYSCATDSNNSSETNNCSEINNSWLVSDGVLFAKGIKNNATYLYKNY